MSTYYYKGAKILAPFTIVSNEPMFDVDTVSLRKQRATQNAQRWEISFNTVAEGVDQVDLFLGSVVDFDEVDTMIMPQLPQVDKLTTASLTSLPISINASQNATSVTLQGVGVSGLMPKGTFFKFSTHDKIYVTTVDADFDSGTPVVSFYPKLRENVTTSDTVKIGNEAVLSFYRSIDNQVGITFQDGILSDVGTLTLIEAL